MKDKNAIVGLMLEIDHLKQEISMYEALAKKYQYDTMANSRSMYSGLKQMAEKSRVAIFAIQCKLAKVGIHYE